MRPSSWSSCRKWLTHANRPILTAGTGKRKGMEAIAIQPGLVLLKRALDMDEQKWLVSQCFRCGERPVTSLYGAAEPTMES